MEYTKYSIVIILVLSFLYFIFKNVSKINLKTILFILGLAIILAIGLIVNNESIQSYILKFSTIILGYILARLLDFKISSDVYIKIMKWISIISILAFLFAKTIIATSFFPVIYTSTRHEAFTTLFFTNIPHLIHLQTRNWGPFWEPGVYQAFLILAIFLSLWNEGGKIKNTNILIFVATLLTTKSTTGYIVLPIVFFAYLLDRDLNKKDGKMKYLLLALVTLSYLFIITRTDISNRVFGKLETFDQSSRWLSTMHGIKIWSENLLFGIGPSNIQETIISLSGLGEHISVTNTWIANFASYGIFIGGLYLVSFIQMIKSIVQTKLAVVIMCLVFSIMLSGENLGGSLLFLYLMFIRVKKEKKL